MKDLVEDEDAALMQQVAGGDGQAFARLYDRHSKTVARFCFRYVGDSARAEELTQDIFVKLYRGAKGYSRTAKFKTFLFRVAANHCLNEVRRGEFKVRHEDVTAQKGLLADPSTSPQAHAEGAEVERALRGALETMSDRERAAFTMCRFEGMAYREIAFALSASEAAVKSLIHRATLVVAKALEASEAGVLPARSRA